MLQFIKVTSLEVKTTQAENAKGNETRSAESHTHGDASLAVVVEGSKVIVELETPLYNLVGFEHAAETEKQKAAVIKAESVLSGGAPLFMFNVEAGCGAPDISGSVKLDIDHGHDDHEDHEDHEDQRTTMTLTHIRMWSCNMNIYVVLPRH